MLAHHWLMPPAQRLADNCCCRRIPPPRVLAMIQRSDTVGIYGIK